jgi:hypothetical protein
MSDSTLNATGNDFAKLSATERSDYLWTDLHAKPHRPHARVESLLPPMWEPVDRSRVIDPVVACTAIEHVSRVE